jgi:hypothetical protein
MFGVRAMRFVLEWFDYEADKPVLGSSQSAKQAENCNKAVSRDSGAQVE